MKVAIALRHEESFTNKRSRPVGHGLALLGHDVRYMGRENSARGYDLLVQTGFAQSRALLTAIDRRIPYIIMEAPMWRPLGKIDENTRASWGYNGLVGGAWAPPAPDEDRPKPTLLPLKEPGGATIIFGQKPTDHSLRGVDHVKWVLEMQRKYPDAELRHHPLMHIDPDRQEPLSCALDRCYRAVTYTSTVGVEALIAGCVSEVHGRQSAAYGIDPELREPWLHELSWRNFDFEEYATAKVAVHIMSGYDEARERALLGNVEHPRSKTSGRNFMTVYYGTFGNGA